MFSEINVCVKDAEKRLSKKFPIYDEYQVSEDNPVIKSCIEEVLKNFDGEPEDIKVTITLEIK